MKKQLLSRAYEMLLEARYVPAKIFDHGVGIYREEGEEAITVGTILAMKDTDIISCYFRGEGSALRFKGGMSLREEMCSWLNRKGETDKVNIIFPSAITDVEHGVIGTSSSLIGGDMDVAVGVALSQKMQKSGKIVVFMSGDGATSKGNFHEMINWASRFNLPLLIIVRGNGWAMSTAVENNTHVSSIPEIVKPFGLNTFECDGNDVEAVYDCVSEAVDFVRNSGPALVYAKTYRMSGHSAHDEDDYRDPAVKEAWRAKDPILNIERKMLDSGIAESEINEIKANVLGNIEDAYQWALTRPQITVEEYLKGQEEVVNKMWQSSKEV